MGSFSIMHWAIVLVVVILIFGTKKIGTIGGDLGKTIREFKAGIKGDDEKSGVPKSSNTSNTTIE